MPYEVSFSKQFTVDHDDYFNPCCWGGDVVVEQILPGIAGRFQDIQTNQEDWGWFIWFKRGPISLAVDVFCDDPQKGEFRLHLYAHRKKWLLWREDAEAPTLKR